MTDKFPSWRYGPNGQSAIFESEKDVPTGWQDHPSKVGATKAAPAASKTAPPAKTAPAADAGALDAHGHPFNADLHAATQSKTKDGLWRLKVGAKRPDPAPGYPLDL